MAAGDLEMELDEETTARQLGMLGQEIKVCDGLCDCVHF